MKNLTLFKLFLVFFRPLNLIKTLFTYFEQQIKTKATIVFNTNNLYFLSIFLCARAAAVEIVDQLRRLVFLKFINIQTLGYNCASMVFNLNFAIRFMHNLVSENYILISEWYATKPMIIQGYHTLI